MSQHFIENIKIENFKCFENLEINDFKRVNVFGGKNNVGKTALLEAIELLTTSNELMILIYHVHRLLERRQSSTKKIDLDLFRRDSMSSPLHKSFSIESLSMSRHEKISISKDFQKDIGYSIMFSIGDEGIGISPDVFDKTFYYESRDSQYRKPVVSSYFVKSSGIDGDEVSSIYGVVIECGKEVFLDNSINKFDPSFLSFRIILTESGIIPKIKMNGRDEFIPISEMGEGIGRYIAILCAIWASQDGFLFIDEIENGIHYSNYKKLWELIFMASEQANCQVFVTTHSKECIEAFNNVQQERNDDTGRYFELYRSEKKQRIVAAVRDAEQLHYSLTHGAAIRGE